VTNYDDQIDRHCENCAHFDQRNSFCRLNPPIPVVSLVLDDMGHKVQKIGSKFPVIGMPHVDYCGQWTASLLNE